jgi:hypothetical protein
MRHHLLLAVVFAGCATSADEAGGPKPGDIPTPMDQGGKGDGEVQCGTSACSNNLCAWDCSAAGQACTQACTTDARADVFVTASANGDTVDSRATPFKPHLALDNVLIYGCELWHFTTGTQGLEIELTELIHSSFTVDPNDPARFQRKLDVYVDDLKGAGDYRASAMFVHSSEADASGGRFFTKDGCSVHAAVDRGGLSGTFSCSLATAGGSTASMTGQFACPGNGLDSPNFVSWTPAS